MDRTPTSGTGGLVPVAVLDADGRSSTTTWSCGMSSTESNPCLDLKKAAAMTAKETGEHRRAGVQLLPTRQGGVKTALASGPADAEF